MLTICAPIEKSKPRLYREGLLRLFAFFSIAASLILPACHSCEENDASTKQISYIFERDYGETEIKRLFSIPKSRPIDRADWDTVAWTDADWSTIPAGQDSAYEVVWFNATSTKTGKSKTARYKVRFTIGTNSPDPGAGFGYGSEVWADILNYQLIDVVKRPKVTPGIYPLLPGECVIRPIPPNNGKGKQLLETYQIEIPSGVHFNPVICVRSIFDSEMVEETVEFGGLQIFLEKTSSTTSSFIARQGGIYTVKVFRTTQKPEKTGGFGLQIDWGRGSGGRCVPDRHTAPEEVRQDAGIEKETTNKKSVSNDKQSNK